MGGMYLTLVVQPIKNCLRKIALCDDILFSVAKRAALVAILWG